MKWPQNISSNTPLMNTGQITPILSRKNRMHVNKHLRFQPFHNPFEMVGGKGELSYFTSLVTEKLGTVTFHLTHHPCLAITPSTNVQINHSLLK